MRRRSARQHHQKGADDEIIKVKVQKTSPPPPPVPPPRDTTEPPEDNSRSRDIPDEAFQDHPLLNPLIVDNLLKLIHDPRELLQPRLVSKLWHEVSLPRWKKLEHPPITLCVEEEEDHRSNPTTTAGPPPGGLVARSMSDFLQYLESSSSNDWKQQLEHYSSFELVAPHQLKHNRRLLSSFWNLCGGWMRKLTVRDFVFPNLKLVREVVLARHTPNLELLDVMLTFGKVLVWNETIVSCGGGGGEHEEHVKLKTLKIGMIRGKEDWKNQIFTPALLFPFRWMELLNYYHKLENLTLYPAGEDMCRQVGPCLTALQAIRSEDRSKLMLKSWSYFDEDVVTITTFMSRRMSPFTMTLLKYCNLELESLGFVFLPGWEQRVSEAIKAPHIRNNLRQLSFYKVDPPCHLGNGFRRLPRLEYLCITGSPHPYDMTFLKDLSPQLRTLKLLKGGRGGETNLISRTLKKNMAGVVLPSLSTYICSYDYKLPREWISRADVRRLSGWMPNLTRLEMGLADESFRGVCEAFPNLEHVRIFGERVGDKGLAGLRMGKEGRQPTCSQPNLSNLQKLQSFVIDNPPSSSSFRLAEEEEDPSKGEIIITEHSVHHGFLKLPCLTKLILHTNGGVSPTAKTLLEENLSFAKIKIY